MHHLLLQLAMGLYGGGTALPPDYFTPRNPTVGFPKPTSGTVAFPAAVTPTVSFEP